MSSENSFKRARIYEKHDYFGDLSYDDAREMANRFQDAIEIKNVQVGNSTTPTNVFTHLFGGGGILAPGNSRHLILLPHPTDFIRETDSNNTVFEVDASSQPTHTEYESASCFQVGDVGMQNIVNNTSIYETDSFRVTGASIAVSGDIDVQHMNIANPQYLYALALYTFPTPDRYKSIWTIRRDYWWDPRPTTQRLFYLFPKHNEHGYCTKPAHNTFLNYGTFTTINSVIYYKPQDWYKWFVDDNWQPLYLKLTNNTDDNVSYGYNGKIRVEWLRGFGIQPSLEEPEYKPAVARAVYDAFRHNFEDRELAYTYCARPIR